MVAAGDASLETGVWFDDDPPQQLTPHRGSELVLNCSVSTSAEFPDVNVTWRKNGEPVRVGPDHRRVRLRSSDWSLVVRRVQARFDNGHYQCAASVNHLGVLLSTPTTVRVAGTLDPLINFLRLKLKFRLNLRGFKLKFLDTEIWF